MKLIESKAAILNAKNPAELHEVVESIIDASRFSYNYDLDYADNAIIAEMNLRYGMAELLRLAAKRERALL
jgi:hypothetical protein